MNTQHIISETITYVKQQLTNAEGGHDWWHIHRVYKTAQQIAAMEEADELVVALGALLHDIADSKFHNGDETVGPRMAREWLQSLQVEQSVIDHVENIITHISFKGGNHHQPFRSIELDIVQDADRLDAIGAIGIARAFSYGGFKNRALYDPAVQPNLNMSREEYKNNNAPTINHFYEKLLLLKDRMNTETGRKLALQRHAFMENYLTQFYQEWDGAVSLDGEQNPFASKDAFENWLHTLIKDPYSAFYQELRESRGSYRVNTPFLTSMVKNNLQTAIAYNLFPIVTSYAHEHLNYDTLAIASYNRPYVFRGLLPSQGYNFPIYYFIRFVGIVYASAIRHKLDINKIHGSHGAMEHFYPRLIEQMVQHIHITDSNMFEKLPTTYHWLIQEIFVTMFNDWMDNFIHQYVEDSSYVEQIPRAIGRCLTELFKGVQTGRISRKFLLELLESAVNEYFNLPVKRREALLISIENNIISTIPVDYIQPVFEFQIKTRSGLTFDDFVKGSPARFDTEDDKHVIRRLKWFLVKTNKLPEVE